MWSMMLVGPRATSRRAIESLRHSEATWTLAQLTEAAKADVRGNGSGRTRWRLDAHGDPLIGGGARRCFVTRVATSTLAPRTVALGERRVTGRRLALGRIEC